MWTFCEICIWTAVKLLQITLFVGGSNIVLQWQMALLISHWVPNCKYLFSEKKKVVSVHQYMSSWRHRQFVCVITSWLATNWFTSRWSDLHTAPLSDSTFNSYLHSALASLKSCVKCRENQVSKFNGGWPADNSPSSDASPSSRSLLFLFGGHFQAALRSNRTLVVCLYSLLSYWTLKQNN